MRNPQLPAIVPTVAPLREGHVRKGGLNRGPSQIKIRPLCRRGRWCLQHLTRRIAPMIGGCRRD